MSYLRKEYKEYKHFKEEIFKEAAEAWTEENVILINERLNRNAIYRLNSAIERFDNKFGPYRDKLPAIADILSNAENGLHLVITGKVGSRTTAQMLQRMSIMYNILSNFFGGDLGALLKTPAFRVSQNQPDEKIDKIADRGHDVKAIRRTLASALKPNDEERMLFRRAYKSFDMPTLDWNMAAKQLCCLSVNELQDLAGIERVPMVVIDEPQEDTNTSGETGLDEKARDTAGKIASYAGGAVVGGAVAGTVIGAKALAKRFSGPTQKDLASMNIYLNAIKNVLPVGEPEFALAKQGLEKLIGNIKKAETGAKVNFDQNWLRNPTAIAISQGKQLIDIFEQLGTAWNSIKSKYKSPLSEQDIKTIEKTLNQQVNSVTSKLGRFFKVNLPKGLTAKELIAALVSVAKRGAGGTVSKETSSQTVSETQTASETLSDEDEKEVASFRSVGTGLRGFNPLLGGSGGGERSAAPVVRESYEFFNHFFGSLPKEMILSENIGSFLEHLELITEDFDDLDKVLTNFAKIKTDVDNKLEKATQSTKEKTSSPAAAPAAAPAAPTAAAPAAAPAKDVQPADIQAAVAANIPEEQKEAINKKINDLNIPTVTNVDSAKNFLKDHKKILEKDVELKKLAELSKLSELVITENKRQNLINQIKKIITEHLQENQLRPEQLNQLITIYNSASPKPKNGKQLANLARGSGFRGNISSQAFGEVINKASAVAPAPSTNPAAAAPQTAQPAAVAQSATAAPTLAASTAAAAPAAQVTTTTPAQTRETHPAARQLYPKIKQRLESLNANTYQEMLGVLNNIPPSESGIKYQLGDEESLAEQTQWIQHFAKPETKNQEFVQNINKITTIGDLRGKVIDLQIAKMNIPGITNRETYKKYKYIIDNIDNISKLITILKTGGTPVAAPAPAATAPAATTTTAATPSAPPATAASKPAG
jgi:hypothetical protein